MQAMRAMRLSFSTGTLLHRSLDYNLRLARDLGFDGVELAIGPEAFYRGLTPLRRAVERVGTPVLSVHPPLAPLPGWPRPTTHRLPRVMGLARDLGAELAITHTMNFYSPDSPRNAHFSQAIRMGRDEADDAVTLTIENNQYVRRGRRRPMAYLDDLRRLVHYAQTRGCGLTFDTCHAGANGEDLLLDYALIRPLLRNVHLNDLDWVDGQMRTHVIPGDGALALRPLLARLAQDGYTGLVTVELHPRDLGDLSGLWSRRAAERILARSLTFMRDAIGQPAGAPSELPAEALEG